jgi:hypothetical protein
LNLYSVNVSGIVTGNITGKSLQLVNLGYLNG